MNGGGGECDGLTQETFGRKYFVLHFMNASLWKQPKIRTQVLFLAPSDDTENSSGICNLLKPTSFKLIDYGFDEILINISIVTDCAAGMSTISLFLTLKSAASRDEKWLLCVCNQLNRVVMNSAKELRAAKNFESLKVTPHPSLKFLAIGATLRR